MFITPLALELARLCLVPSFGGEEERPWTAESTLVSGSDMLMDGVLVLRGVCLIKRSSSVCSEEAGSEYEVEEWEHRYGM